MGKSKYNEDYIRKFLEGLGCELLSEYKNTSTNFKYKCSCGEVSESNFNRFKNGQKGCWNCKGKRSNQNNKLTIEFVSEFFKNNDCLLLEKEYVNNSTKMKYVCSCGTEDYKTWDNFKQGQRCKECAKEKKRKKRQLNFEDVKRIYLQNNCKLIEKQYLNNHAKMDFECHCGNVESMTLKEFRKHRECRICANILKYDRQKIIDIFKENNCTLFIDKYINNQQEVIYLCSCGDTEKVIIHNFIHSIHKKCKNCTYKIIGEKQSHDYNYVKTYFESKNCVLLSTEYYSNARLLDYICSCGSTSKINFNSFKSGRRCSNCAIKSGENHSRWNHDLSDEEREMKRNYPEYRTWRSAVYNRDNYTCQCCGDNKGGNLVAHHLDGWDWNKIDRFNIDNGITLCSFCHDDFHGLYDYGGNTKEQFKEYMNDIYQSII